jgi:hypothetical protein
VVHAATCKSLDRLERDFGTIKAIDLDLRPIHHWTETKVRTHVFIRMLGTYVVWHLRAAWAPPTNTGPTPGSRRQVMPLVHAGSSWSTLGWPRPHRPLARDGHSGFPLRPSGLRLLMQVDRG